MSASNLSDRDRPGNRLEPRSVPLSGDTEIRIHVIAGLAGGAPSLDVRLYRRGIPGTGLTATAAGFRCPLPTAGLLVDAIRAAATQAADR
jgi:hypothetical protein